MKIERTDDEIIIRLSSSFDNEDLQGLIDYLRYKEVTANSKARQEDVDELARQVNREWWEKKPVDHPGSV